MKKESGIISEFRSDAKVILLALDQLIFDLKMHKDDHEDVEEIVHDIRIHFRKLVSLLYFYRPLLKRKSYRKLIRNIKKLLRSFGYQRNLHMFEKHVRKFIEESSLKQESLTALFDREMEKLDAHTEDKDYLDPLAFRVLYENTLKLLLGYGREIFKDRVYARDEQLDSFILRRYTELMENFGKMEKDLDFDDEKGVHQLRIEAKNINYFLKSKEETLGEVAARRGEHLKEIQNVAGRIHDIDVHLKRLRKFHVLSDEEEIFEDFQMEIRKDRSMRLNELRKVVKNEK